MTDGNGQCSVTMANINRRSSSVTFTPTGIAIAGSEYMAADNHDPDGDSDGTAIVVSKP